MISPLSPSTSPAPPRAQARVVFSFRGERDRLRAQVARGEAPDEFLYGFPEVRGAFPLTRLIEPKARTAIWNALFRPLEIVTRRLGYPLFFSAPLARWADVRSADLLVATTDSTGIPLLLLKRAGLIRGAILLISQGLHSIDSETQNLRWRVWLKRQLGACLEQAAAIVTLGSGDTHALAATFDIFRLPPLREIHFGIDAEFWRPREAACALGDYVLSVGSDRLRDYPTLLRGIGEMPLQIVTRLPLPPELLGKNVQVKSRLTWPELRALYQRALFVVTPVLDQARDSGHSATLQAMACGKAVILSDTAGLWDREKMRHRETCYLVKPGDPDALREAIQHLRNHPDEAAEIGRRARLLVKEHATSKGFGLALRDLVESCLQEAKNPGLLSRPSSS